MMEDYLQLDRENYLQTFKRYPIVFKRGEGRNLWDTNGKKYLDMLAGIAVNNIGYAHPIQISELSGQLNEMLHISNFFLSEPQVDLSKKLVDISGMDRVFFANSGAEAVEGAIKLARKYAHSKGRGGTVISMTGSFHGRTLGTIATGKKSMQEGFEPIPHGFKSVEFNDIEALKNAINDNVGAVILELIQGEGGINPADPEYVKELRKITKDNNIALIIDEIQTGVGRTGKWFAKDHYGIQPDVMSLAKGLGGGVPIGAVLCTEEINAAINYGDHGTTFGGNPLACKAGSVCINIIEDEGLLQNALDQGQYLKEEILRIGSDEIIRVKGKGLMIGIEFKEETKDLVARMLEKGVIANSTAGNILRLVPPLNITKEEIDEFIKVLKETITELYG